MQWQYLTVGASCFLLWYWWVKLRPRSAARGKAVLIVYDGRAWVVQAASRDGSGNIVSDAVTWPGGTPVPMVNDTGSPLQYYFLGVTPEGLSNHTMLERARANIVKGSLFRSGGELIETAKLVAVALVCCSALYALMTISSFNGAIAAQTAKLDQFEKTLSKPLVAVPAPSPAPAPGASVAP